MENLVVIAIWITLILCVLTILLASIFGVRSISHGKLRAVSAISVAVPVVITLIFYFIVGDWVEAAIWASIIMMVLAVAALVLSGVRGVAR